jgi:hypothetical protein
MTPRLLRWQLFTAWCSITRSLLALAFDRRMSEGLSHELVDCTHDGSRILNQFRRDVAIDRFGSRWLTRPNWAEPADPLPDSTTPAMSDNPQVTHRSLI